MGRGDFSVNAPLDRQFSLGGHNSLRGFSQDRFYATRAVVASLEFRQLTSKTDRAYIFTDMAIFQYNEMPFGNRNATDIMDKYGIGIGFAAEVGPGMATIEIAVPGDVGFSDTKLHFGLRAGL